jgi:CHAT domain-containing protein
MKILPLVFTVCFTTTLLAQNQQTPSAALDSLTASVHRISKTEESKTIKLMVDSLEKQANALAERFPEKAANALMQCAYSCSQIGQNEKNILWCEKSAMLYEKSIGKNNLSYLKCVSKMAAEFSGRYEIESAEQYFKIAENLVVKNNYTNTKTNAIINSDRGIMFFEASQYNKAEKYLLESMKIWNILKIDDDLNYDNVLKRLSTLYVNSGNYELALTFAKKSLVLNEKMYGKNNPNYSNSSLEVAQIYITQSAFDKAKPYFDESFDYQKIVDGDNPKRYRNLLRYGNLYLQLGDFEKAGKLLLLSKGLAEKATGNESADYSLALHNLASYYHTIGKNDTAIIFYNEAIKIRAKVLGENHIRYARSKSNLGEVYRDLNKYDKAADNLIEAMNIFTKIILQSTTHSSIFELKQLMEFYRNQISGFYQLNQEYKSEALSQATYDNTLNFKGFLLENTLKIERLKDIKTDSVSFLIHDWKELQSSVSTEYNKPKSAQKGLADLEIAVQSKEKEISRLVSNFAETRQSIHWKDVQSSLRPNEAAIEFVHFNYGQRIVTDSVFYAALVLRFGDTAPHFVTLFEKKALISLFLKAKGNSFSKINELYNFPQPNSSQKNLYELIWQPLENLLKDTKKIYCSPSGLLHQINLGAIAVNATSTFENQHNLVVLGSTRQLVADSKLPIAVNNKDAYLVGGVRYSMDSTAISSANHSRSRGLDKAEELTYLSDTITRGDKWTFLPETAKEVQEISLLLQKSGFSVQTDTGFIATEEAFRALGKGRNSPRIVHLSTHGFFYPDPTEDTPSTTQRTPIAMNEPVFKRSDHPMIRTGLILAGGNHVWSGKQAPTGLQDGILTAYEISQMNLSSTELVVLSACETGLGDIQGNEGVIGLQRALKIAGAKYIIMSLWKVNDQTTRELMSEFYKQWLEKKLTVPEAFRIAQIAIRTKYPDAPFHWAGFVLVE